MKIFKKPREENKKIRELDSFGVSIDEVYGSKRTSLLLVCLCKAIIIFMVCFGTVSGFSDAFSLNYNKGLIAVVTIVMSALITMLYFNKKFFYIGYTVMLIAFTIELIRYYLYANSGFQAMMNRVREVYADHFGMSIVRTAEERYTNRYVTITIALIFITFFLIIMFNITVSRYMNFVETFFISFIILEIPLYVGYKPPVFSVFLVMTGCVCTGILHRGGFNRIIIPGKHSPDYIPDTFFKKKSYYTTRGSAKGILIALGFSAVFALFMNIFSIPVYDRPLGETSEKSAKASVDDYVRIFVQNGLYGLFNRYDSLNGMNRGILGGVSSVRPDFQTDIIVNFVPDSTETVYLPGFYGSGYSGSNWSSVVEPSTYGLKNGKMVSKEFGSTTADMILNSDLLAMYDDFLEKNLGESDDLAKMEINYVDAGFGMEVAPYNTLNEDIYEISNPVIASGLEEKNYNILLGGISRGMRYLPFSEVENSGKTVEEIDKETDFKHKYGISFTDYIKKVCTYVPDSLGRYLKTFIKDHNNLGINIYEFRYKDDSRSFEDINNMRLKAVEAVEQLFIKEYPYSLSPGKTPENEDFVRYFLETQKRGFCSHFASAGAMLLRYLGIPARYVEGYCVPSSLIRENAALLNNDGSDWYEGDNEYNPTKKVYSVEVSDYYAHAWVEIYLEGIGFVPVEVTPPNFGDVPSGGALSGLGDFFSRLMNVDLGLGGALEDTLSITGDVSETVSDIGGFSFDGVLMPLGLLVLATVLFWLIFILIRYMVREIRYKGYYKTGNFRPLIYARYNGFVKKLKRKNIVSEKNPLPMELCGILAERTADLKELESVKTGAAVDRESVIGRVSEEYRDIFTYAEKVLYSDYDSTAEEYDVFYAKLKNT